MLVGTRVNCTPLAYTVVKFYNNALQGNAIHGVSHFTQAMLAIHERLAFNSLFRGIFLWVNISVRTDFAEKRTKT